MVVATLLPSPAAVDLICSILVPCTRVSHAVPLVRAISASLVACMYIHTLVKICDAVVSVDGEDP